MTHKAFLSVFFFMLSIYSFKAQSLGDLNASLDLEIKNKNELLSLINKLATNRDGRKDYYAQKIATKSKTIYYSLRKLSLEVDFYQENLVGDYKALYSDLTSIIVNIDEAKAAADRVSYMAKKFLAADNNKKPSYYSKIVSNYNTINEKLKESKVEILDVASTKFGIDFKKKN